MNNGIINDEPDFIKESIKAFIEISNNIKYQLGPNRSRIFSDFNKGKKTIEIRVVFRLN